MTFSSSSVFAADKVIDLVKLKNTPRFGISIHSGLSNASYTFSTLPSHGVFEYRSGSDYIKITKGMTVDMVYPVVYYTVDNNYIGLDSFAWTSTDGTTIRSGTCSITFKNNTPPEAKEGTSHILEESENKRIFLTFYDPDVNQTKTFTIMSVPSSGTIASNSGTSYTVLKKGDIVTNSILYYTPNKSYIGLDSFTWKVSDGIDDSNISTHFLSVYANTVPKINRENLNLSILKNTSLSLTPYLKFSEKDSEQTNTFILTSSPTYGQIKHGNVILKSGSITTDLSWVYTPNPNFTGQDAFSWKIFDGLDNSVTANVMLKVISTMAESKTPTFKAGVVFKLGGSASLVDKMASPELCDWNNDGLIDMVIGQEDGRVRIYLNKGTKVTPLFPGYTFLEWETIPYDVDKSNYAQQNNHIYGYKFYCSCSGGNSASVVPRVVDWNNDGKKDIIFGSTGDGETKLFSNKFGVSVCINIGTDADPRFDNKTWCLLGSTLPSNGWATGGRPASMPFITDINGDGFLDIISGENNIWFTEDAIRGFKGGKSNGLLNIFLGTTKSFYGDRDIMRYPPSTTGSRNAHQYTPTVEFYYGPKTAAPLFGNKTPNNRITPTMTMDACPIGSRKSVIAADWNGNGKKDLMIGMQDGSVWFSPNIGEASLPVFKKHYAAYADGAKITVGSSIHFGKDLGYHSFGPTPSHRNRQNMMRTANEARLAVGDLNGDGLPDLIVGDSLGGITYFEQKGVTKETYTITSSTDSNGSVSPLGSTTVAKGNDISYTLSAKAGYVIKDVLVDNISVGVKTSHTFINVTSNHTIQVKTMVKTFSITSSTGSNGSISPLGKTTVDYNGSQIYTMTPSNGYMVDQVLVDGDSKGAITSYEFSKIMKSHTIAVSYKVVPAVIYTVTSSADSNGLVSPLGSTTVAKGNDISYTLSAKAGYEIKDVLVDNISVGVKTSHTFINVSSNHTIQVKTMVKTFSITSSTGSNGSISPLGKTTVDYNGSQIYTMTPSNGYMVDQVLVDGDSKGAITSYEFSKVMKSHTIAVSYKVVPTVIYTVTSSTDSNGSVSPLGSTTVAKGNDISYTLSAKAGYEIKDVLVDNISVGVKTTYTFINVTSNHTIQVKTMVKTFSITSSTGSNGSISPLGKTMVDYNGSKVFTMKPNVGYLVDQVLVDGKSVGDISSYSFSSISSNSTISVTFKIKSYNIISSAADTNGSISPLGSSAYHYHSEQTYIISPDNGYAIKEILVDGVSKGIVSRYTFSSIDKDHTIAATFLLIPITHTIFASSGSNGSISPTGSIIVGDGADISFNITPDKGYEIKEISVDDKPIGAISLYKFTNVITDHTIAVTFELTSVTHTILASSGINGAISPKGNVIVNDGEAQIFAFTPDAGYEIESVIIDDKLAGALSSVTFKNVTGDHSIVVHYQLSSVSYIIEAKSGENGSISPSGNTTVTEGASQIYKITPNVGYKILSILVDGTSVPISNTFLFNNVIRNHSIQIFFEEIPVTHVITSAVASGGSITPSGDTFIEHGDNQKYIISPEADHELVDVIIDGKSIGAVKEYTFKDITSSHTIKAQFKRMINSFNLSVIAHPNGDALPKGNLIVGKGKALTIKFNPNLGFSVKKVVVDGIDLGVISEYKFFNISKNHTVAVFFKSSDVKHQIYGTSGFNGTISPSGILTVSDKSSQVFKFTPDKGFKIADIIIDGKSRGSQESYRFLNISNDHTIDVQFEENYLKSSNEITSFSFNSFATNINGDINDDEIILFVPADADIYALVASFTHTGVFVDVKHVEQLSGISYLDFRSTVKYAVTAEDGSVRYYKVTVYKNDLKNPGLIGFEFPKYSVSEESGEMIVKVLRSNGHEGQASVKVNILEVSAEKNKDYSCESVVLTWAAGDISSKGFKVNLLKDKITEDTESFLLRLVNFKGGNKGSTYQTEIFIRDGSNKSEENIGVIKNDVKDVINTDLKDTAIDENGGCNYSSNLNKDIRYSNLLFWLLFFGCGLLCLMSRHKK